MTRLELSTRIQSRLDRYDTTTVTEILQMITEVIRTIEQTYPLAYLKKSQESVLTASNAIYTLPATLIYHHPYDLLLEATALDETYSFLVKTSDSLFNQQFTDINTIGTPEYWRITGGTVANEIQLYPVHSTARTLKIGNGFFYTSAFTADGDNTWLTSYYPDLVVEGVCAKMFRHYGEMEKALDAGGMYQIHLNGSSEMGVLGLLQTERKTKRSGRILRIKTFDDMPLSVAKRQKNYGA